MNCVKCGKNVDPANEHIRTYGRCLECTNRVQEFMTEDNLISLYMDYAEWRAGYVSHMTEEGFLAAM